MSVQNHDWGTIHPAVYRHAAGPMQQVAATRRAHGALRYRCPIAGSFVLVTDEATLGKLARRHRLRCVGCGEMHLVIPDAGPDDCKVIVATPAKP